MSGFISGHSNFIVQKALVTNEFCLLTEESNNVANAVISNSDLFFVFPCENVVPAVQPICPFFVNFSQNLQKQIHFSLEVKNKIAKQIQCFIYSQTLLFSNGFFIFDIRKIRI
jgi:hypothetical protein